MGMQEIAGIKVWGDPVDDAAYKQIVTCAKTATEVALMADHHKGYAVPIGGVVAYIDKISPSGVGYDIGCGNKAVRLDIPAREVKRKIKKLMDEIYVKLSFGMGRNNAEEVDHELFDDEAWKIGPMRSLKQTARNQLGTIGGGNHYLDLFIDEQERVWVGAHFGSRGLGHKTATHFLEMGQAQPGMDAEPLVLDTRSSLGSEYLACMELAGKYAYAGRDWVCGKVARILGAKIVEEIHNHHNYCIPGDANIPTPTGPKRMEEIRRGDIVYAFDRCHGIIPVTVLESWCSGAKPIYTIETANRSLRVSGEHPVLTVSVVQRPHPERPWFNKRQGGYVWKRADEIKEGDILVCSEGYYESSVPEQGIGLDLARFVGAFLGDGWIRHTGADLRGYTVGLGIGKKDEIVTARYLALCQNLFPYVEWKSNTPGAFGLTCSSVRLYNQIVSLDMGCYSHQKHLPVFSYTLPKDEKMALLAGYFDSDGSVADANTSNHGRGTVCSASKELVEGLREIAISCGLQVTNVRRDDKVTNFGSSITYRCVLSADSIAQLDLWHEKKVANLRKSTYGRNHHIVQEKLGYLPLPAHVFGQRVRKISVSNDTETVYDLTIDHPEHAFICEGVVVHNCWKETHHGQEMYVVRKGATPAFPGQKGFVGGSMGDISVILEGVDSEESKAALYSTVHGAGRVMSRTAAKGKMKGGKVVSPGAVTPRMMEAWVVRDKGVELRGGGTDESPHCYKRIEEVLAHHQNTVRILHTLTPIGVAMAGENEFDPYKD